MKNNRKTLFNLVFSVALSLLFSVADARAPMPTEVGTVKNWNPRKPLELATSYHSYIMSSEKNVHISFESPGCLTAIRDFLNSGKNFSSKVVLEKSIPMKTFPQKDTPDNTFYHYTRSLELKQIANEKSYDQIFSYLRLPPNSGAYFYIAADENSSSDYGHYKYQISLGEKALIAVVMTRDHETREQIRAELVARDSSLKPCSSHMLKRLSFEASGISAVAYYGINNINFTPGYQWLEVVGPWAITNMVEEKM